MDLEGLDSQAIDCPACGVHLLALEHSGFYDDWFLYCDSCPIRAEVSYYAPQCKPIHVLPAEARHAALEAALAPCACGGRFRFDSARRCYSCATVVLEAPCWTDLWPRLADVEDGQDPTPDEQAWFDAILQRLTRTTDLWRAV
jgi:hypothetical protein